MNLICTFEDFTFNTGEKFYQCIIKDQKVPQNEQFDISGQHLLKKYDSDVTFVEFRDCDCPKVPQGLTKIFPNLKVLSFDNSKLKELTKNDMAEYKRLQRFICHKNEVDFLPGDLFEEFKDLTYIKFTYNKLGIVEPDFLDFPSYLQYINFKSNPDIHKFSGGWDYQRSTNALLGMVTVAFYHNFLNADIKFIRDYIFKSEDPKNRLYYLSLYTSHTSKSKFNILELKYELYEAARAKDIEMIKKENQELAQKVVKLQALNDEFKDEVKELEDSKLKINQQVDECSRDLENVKEEGSKIAKTLQSQMDNLFRQFQSILSERSQNKV